MRQLPSPTYEWQQIRGIEVEPIIIYRGAVDPHTRKMVTQRPYLTWWRLLLGAVRVNFGDRDWRAEAGQWILSPAGPRREHDFTDDADILSISFDARWPGGLPLLRLPSPLLGVDGDCPELITQGETVCEIVESTRGEGRRSAQSLAYTLEDGLHLRAALDGFVRGIVGLALANGGSLAGTGGDDARLDQILESLQANLQAGPLPYRQWTRETGLSRTQVDRLALAHLHVSLRRHRDRLLLAEACRRLNSDVVPIKQIASELGFVDTAHFCRWLRTHTGHSPLTIRRHVAA